jgi:hypothetical protein
VTEAPDLGATDPEPDARSASDFRSTTNALGLALVLATLPYWEVLTARRSAMYGDVNDLSVPQYTSVWRTITDGDWPWWTPGIFGGHSTVGAGQFAVFYPLNAIFGLLEPVTAYRWWLLAHLWIGTAGAFLWCWRRFGSRSGAVVTAVAWSGCGFAVLHLVHPPFVMAVAWLPFAFLGVDLVRDRWTTGRAALVALPLALIAFAGQPQLLWIALLGLGVYAVVGEVVLGRGEGSVREGVARLLRAGAAVAIGLGLAAVQLLPLWLLSRTSQRPSLSMADAFDNDALPRHLLTAVFPWLFGGSTYGSDFSSPWLGGDIHHEVGTFVGATILALAVIGSIAGASRPTRRREPVVLALAAVVVVSVVVGLGEHTPLGGVIYDVVPLAGSFRAWARTMVLANLALALLAGLGVREVLAAPRRVVVPLGVGAIGLAVVALLVRHVGSLDQALPGGTYGVLSRNLPIAFLLGLAVAAALLARRPRLGAGVLVAVCALEVTAFAYPGPWRGLSGPIDDLEAYYDEAEPPGFGRPFDAVGGVDRWVSDTYGLRMVSLVKDMAGINGYDPLIQEEWGETAAGFVYDGYPRRPDFWEPGWLADVLRVTTLIANQDVTPSDPSWRRVGDVPDDLVRWEREPRLPEAYLVGAVTVAPLADVRDELSSPEAPLDRVAYVDGEHLPAELLDAGGGATLTDLDEPGAAGDVVSADLLESDRSSGRVVVDASRPALLVVSHAWEEGWSATVDGVGADVVRTNGLVLGVLVPEGEHVVRLRFRPPGLTAGALLAALSVLALLAGGPVGTRLAAYRRRHSGR